MKVIKILVPILISFITMTVLVLELVHDHKKRKLIVGTLCAVFAVGMYISPLTVMVNLLLSIQPIHSSRSFYNFLQLVSIIAR